MAVDLGGHNSLFVVLVQTDLGGVLYARSRSGIMCYESYGAARSAAANWLKQRALRGYSPAILRIVPISIEYGDLRMVWDQYPQTEIRSERDLATEWGVGQ